MPQDTAGQERFHALGPIYYRESQGAVLVYDITDEDSFSKVPLASEHRLSLALLLIYAAGAAPCEPVLG